MKLDADIEAQLLTQINLIRKTQDVAIILMTDPTHRHFVGFTVGLTNHNLPEFICFGVRGETVGVTLDGLANYAKEHGELPDQWIDEDNQFSDLQLQVRDVKPFQARDVASPVIKYFEQQNKWPRFQQIVIPDRNNNLPDHPFFESDYMRDVYGQRLLWEEQSITLQ